MEFIKKIIMIISITIKMNRNLNNRLIKTRKKLKIYNLKNKNKVKIFKKRKPPINLVNIIQILKNSLL